MSKDLISIIVPAYNLGDYIERTLNSICEQTYPELEIIVVDDGSVDSTGEIIDACAEKSGGRIKAIHKENSGVTGARLAGVRAAKGQWIGFVDGDDLIDSDMYARLIANAEKCDCDISHCGYRLVFPDGRTNYFHNTGVFLEQDNTQGLEELLDGSIVEPGLVTKLFRRELFEGILNNDEMDMSIKINEDLLMNFLLFSRSRKSIFEDFCPYQYLVRMTSASRQKLNHSKLHDPVRVKKKILEAAPEAVRSKAVAAYVRTLINSYTAAACQGDKSFREDKKKLRSIIISEKGNFPLLSKALRLRGEIIVRLPFAYALLYKFYSRFIQRKQYE